MTGFRTLGDTLRRDYARQEIKMRGELRMSVKGAVEDLTGDRKARMWWTFDRYYRFVYLRYGLKLVGWPEGIIWRNLSDITGRARIAVLHALWAEGELRFEPVTPAERAAAILDPRKAAPARMYLPTRPKLGRKDLKAHKFRPKKNPQRKPGRYVRNGPKSDKWVSAAAERRAEMAQVVV